MREVSTGRQNVYQYDDRSDRPFERNLLDFSSAGIKYNTSLIRSSRTVGLNDPMGPSGNNYGQNAYTYDDISEYMTISGENDYIAKRDQNYSTRREFLRKFSLQTEIEMVIEMIANEIIVFDDNGYFAYPDVKALSARLRTDKNAEIIDDLNNAFRRVYSAWKFNEGDDAWHWVKKFLIDGFLCFEILYNTDEKTNKATEIIGFKELDALTIEPDIKYDQYGNEYKIWIINKGGTDERELPDTNVIYLSWAKTNFLSRLSYVEKLVRPFNMLRTMENSHVIWNVQNSQKRINVTVPTSISEVRGRSRMSEIKAIFKEDISIDSTTGELVVNGQPNFQFYKTFFTPSKGGEKIEISEIDTQGHDMNTTESLKYFWQRFMISTELPKDRFSMIFDTQSAPAISDKSSMTKEEYKFNLFIKRVRSIFKEMLVKPMWIQFCIKYPNFATNNTLKSSVGIKYINENIFEKERERAMFESGAQTIQTLSQIKRADGQTPLFASKFLFEKFLLLSEDDWKINEKYIEEERKEKSKNQNAGVAPQDGGMAGADMGAGMDMGGGMDLGGGGDAGAGMELGGGMDLGGGVPEQTAPPGGEPSVQDNFATAGAEAAGEMTL